MKNLDLFKHELCIDFSENYVMDKEETERFHEAFSHFHKILTDINGKYLQNAIWLQDNFMDLHNHNNTKEMLEKVIQHGISSKVINK